MAQAVKAIPSALNQALSDAGFVDIPGLSITILNGSGWIKISYNLNIANTREAINIAYIKFLLDGLEIANTSRTSSIAQSGTETLTLLEMIKPGAGTHTYKLQSYSSWPSNNIIERQAILVIEEPGF